MARKLPQLQRVLDAPACVGCVRRDHKSLYFALGVIAARARVHAPRPRCRVLFLIVALSYAEGTASMKQGGGHLRRFAFNDLAGFAMAGRSSSTT